MADAADLKSASEKSEGSNPSSRTSQLCFFREYPMSQTIDLTAGGKAVVFIGNYGFIREFESSPSVQFIDAKDATPQMIEPLMPGNTKCIILTDGISILALQYAKDYCERKGIPYLARNNYNSILQTLQSFFKKTEAPKPAPEEVADGVKKGKLKPLIQHLDLAKSNGENARSLMIVARGMGITTTEASLHQLAAAERKRVQGGTVPKSARPQLDVTVDMLDEAIKNLEGMRDFLIEVTEENRMLRKKVERFKLALED